MIKGFAERDHGTGTMERADPDGLVLSRTTEQEDLADGVEPYGIRANERGNQDGDSFQPIRDTGCRYHASDAPGFVGVVPGEHVRFRFEFSGGPVDQRDRRIPAGRWSTWVAEGDWTRPKPPSKKPAPKRPARRTTTPRPYRGGTGASRPMYYAGGIDPDPAVHETYDVTIRFRSGGQEYFTEIEVEVLSVDAAKDRVWVRTTNLEPLDVAPEGQTPLIVAPQRTGYFLLSELDKPTVPMALPGP
jgi:hypothetical protein